MRPKFDFGFCTFSEYDADGFLGVQVDMDGEGSSSEPSETLLPYGFWSRPDDPENDANNQADASKAVQAWKVWDGDRLLVMPLSDPRTQSTAPTLQKGEAAIFSTCGAFVRVHRDGRVSMFTTDDGTTNGKSVSLSLKPDGLEFSAPWGTLRFNASGFHVLTQSGATFNLGAVGGLPAPFGSLSSYARITAGVVDIQGGVTSIGAENGAADSAVPAKLLTTYLTALTATLQAMQLQIDAIVLSAPGASTVLLGNPGIAPVMANAKSALAAITTVPPLASNTQVS